MPSLSAEKRCFQVFFGLNKCSQKNGRLSPVACHTCLESLCISGQFQLSGNHFSASYKASDFCWQTRLCCLQHLRPSHLQQSPIPSNSMRNWKILAHMRLLTHIRMKPYAESAWPALQHNSFIHFLGVRLKFYPSFVCTALSWWQSQCPPND